MRAVIQRVRHAHVAVNGAIAGEIGAGLCILLGVESDDTDADLEWLANKIVKLRIFNDENAKMNKSLLDTQGDILLISQFTLYAECMKGNRPSFIKAASPPLASSMYNKAIEKFEQLLLKRIRTGVFGADMQVQILNDGPVTIILDTKNKELF